MRKDKLNPDAEAALRKLLLEIWSFNGRVEDSSMTTQDFDEPPNELTEKFCNIYTDIDEIAYRGLKLLGFDCWEDLEESVWAKKPKSEPIYEGTGILDLKVTGFKEASA